MAPMYEDNPSFCTTCGREVDPGARFCDNCGAVIDPQGTDPQYAPGMPYQGQMGYGGPVNVPNYLVQAILVTICCCLPAGIVAIVYAAQVNGKVAAGDLSEAQRLSNSAKTWCWVSLGVGLAVIIIYGVVSILGLFSGFLAEF